MNPTYNQLIHCNKLVHTILEENLPILLNSFFLLQIHSMSHNHLRSLKYTYRLEINIFSSLNKCLCLFNTSKKYSITINTLNVGKFYVYSIIPNLDYDRNFEGLKGHDVATPRFRYMAQVNQDVFSYINPEKLTAFTIRVNGQLSTALYGTGDTQVIGRLGPTLHTQYRRWMQDIGYHFSAYDDHTPMTVFDAYRYGKQNVYLREYLRVCKYLTLSWFGSINVTDDAPNHRRIQENGFYVTVGPDDYRLNLGYDFQRRTLYCVVEVCTDAKGTKVDYEKMEIKQKKKTVEDKTPIARNKNTAPTKPAILQRAEVENIKVLEDVL